MGRNEARNKIRYDCVTGTRLCRVSPTCCQGQVQSWLGLRNTSSVEYTSCRPAETGRAGQEGSEGQMRRRG